MLHESLINNALDSLELAGRTLTESELKASVESKLTEVLGRPFSFAEQEEKSEDEQSGYRHLERYRGNFRRSLRLPEDVDGAAIKASYKNGVLALTVPKPPKVEPEVLQVPVTVE